MLNTCEASRGAVGTPTAAKPVPVQHNLTTTAADIRDVEVAKAVPHDGLPTEHCLASEEFSEESDALLLDFHGIVETKTVFQAFGFLEIPVESLTLHPLAALLFVVEPEFDRCEVVLCGPNGFQLGVHDHLRPVRVDGADGTVNMDDGVGKFGSGLRLLCFDFSETENVLADVRESVALAHSLDERGIPATRSVHRHFQFVNESRATESKPVGHDAFSFP